MSLDDVRNPHHAAALERGDVPALIPERAAAERIGQMLFKHLDAHGTFSDKFKAEVGNKCVAHRKAIRAVFNDLDANPHRIGERDPIVLRQQRTAQFDDLDFFLEEAAYHKNAYEAAMDMVDRISARRLPEYDPDVLAQDREDDRLREQRQDEAANREAVRP